MSNLGLAILAISISVACAIPVVESDVAAAREQFVAELNAMPGMTWKAAVSPRFAHLPVGAAKDLCGVKPGSAEMLHAAISSGKIKKVTSEMLGAVDVPDSFDSATNWPNCATVIDDIRDQSACGCCWAFGAAEAASDRMCIASNASLAMPLSAQDVCFCGSENGCGGGFLPSAWEYIQNSGVVTGAQQTGDKANDDPFASGGFCSRFSLPHCHHHGPVGKDPYPAEGTTGCPKVSESPSCPTQCDSDAKAPHATFGEDKYSFNGEVSNYRGEDAIQKAIMTDGPVEAAFTVMSDFENYAGGVYQNKGGSMLGGHAIRIVGWGVDSGTKYWKVANSWNKFWGENGYFRILRGSDECGIESQVVASSTGAKWGKKGSTPPGPPTPPAPPSGTCAAKSSQSSCAAASCHWCVFWCQSEKCI
jgi:cathepsin B